MRVLLVVLLACAALGGLMAWRFRGAASGRTAHSGPTAAGLHLDEKPGKAEMADVRQSAAAAMIGTPAEQSSQPDAEPAAIALRPQATPPVKRQPVAAQGAIRWAGQGNQQRLRQQLVTAKAALSADPSNVAALDDALAAARGLEEWQDVRDLLRRRTVAEPDNREARLEYVSVLMRLQFWMEAVTELRVLVDAQPQDELSWFNLAVAYQALGRLGEARAAWDQLLTIAPDRTEARARRGEILLDLGLWAEAAADFRIVAAQQPDSIDAALNLSSALWKNQDPEGARAVLEALVARAPTNVLALNRLAELLWKERGTQAGQQAARAKQAESLCRSSLALNPRQPEVAALLESIMASR